MSSKVCKHSPVLAEGSCKAFNNWGTMAWISGFLMTLPRSEKINIRGRVDKCFSFLETAF